MRGRKKEPEGKRVAISVKVSEQMAADVDAACGGDRSAWVRGLIAAALEPAPGGRPRRTPERPARAPVTVTFRPPHAVTCKCGTCKPPASR